jgi:hypothetical protein
MPLDLERLRKLLGMTGSSQDGEALNAMRMANKMLVENKLTWADVIPNRTVHEVRPGPRPDFWQRSAQDATDRAAEAARRAGDIFQEELRKHRYNADLQKEKAAIAKARVQLDEILKRGLSRAKAEHFLAIQREHISTGQISSTHRSQIHRAFHSMDGWDQSIGVIDERAEQLVPLELRVYEGAMYATDCTCVERLACRGFYRGAWRHVCGQCGSLRAGNAKR